MSNSRIKELEDKIFKARIDYYNNQPVVSDKAYDAWVDELRVLSPSSKAVTAVGAPTIPSEWKKARHQIPMGSLDKVNTPEEFSKWADEVAAGEKLFVMDKLDGLSIELIYEDSKFVQAITRGDGVEGEDITVNVIKMKGVHQSLLSSNFTGSLRGEIVMLKSVHQKHFSDKSNPRNAASGTSKRLDGVGSEHLNVILYQVLGNIDFATEEDQERWLIFNCCEPPISKLCSTVQEVNDYWRQYQDQVRNQLDYDIDGLVIRINNLDKQAMLGDKDLRPKGAKAFKFDNETRETTLINVEWQVGNSGRITPVAILEPVILCGAEIERASLHNVKWLEELDLYIGCKVLVSRRNDVIPYVEEKIV